MGLSEATADTKYRIGAVSKLTGIPTVTIRMWERRYGVTNPERTGAGGRLYSDHDVQRLGLLKRAVDSGQSISAAAALEPSELEKVCQRLPSKALSTDRPLHIAALGDYLSDKLASATLPHCELVGAQPAAAVSQLLELVQGVDVDVLVVELQTLDDSSHQQVAKLRQQVNASKAVVVYHFARSEVLARLAASNTIETLQAPFSVDELIRCCAAGQQLASNQAGKPTADKARFSSSQLSELAKLTSVVKCECPKHMAELVHALQAFEGYAEQCESNTVEEAAVHRMLYTSTGQARALMESALVQLIEHEIPDYFQGGR